jgi:SAM-dependent methyltransferase
MVDITRRDNRSLQRISMDWVRSFYEKQHQWANVYTGAVEAYHRDKAESIVLPNREGSYRILELGCGGGQMTAALAEAGHSLTAVDLNPAAIQHARQLAADRPDAQITLIEADFYTINPEGPFDIVCYFDGFGIGTDSDQQRLLQRIFSWLKEDGRAFIEIYTPWYWARMNGRTMEWPDASRRYGFDEDGCRMLDTWWPTGHPSANTFRPTAPLEEAMRYMAVLERR